MTSERGTLLQMRAYQSQWVTSWMGRTVHQPGGFLACIMWKNDKSIRKTRLSYTRSAFRTMAPSEGKSDQMLTLFQSVFVPRNVISKLSLAINNISNGDFFLACIIPVLRHVPLNDCKPRFPCWKHIFYTFMSTLDQIIAPKKCRGKI